MTRFAELTKSFRFEAAHYLPKVPSTHKCHSLHGHSYKVTVRAYGPIDENMGWVMDLSDISDNFKHIKNLLDHKTLNNIKGLENPTSENLALFILDNLAKKIPQISSVTVYATSLVSVTVKTNPIPDNNI